uniref:Integrase catalytic domain-containing protein n=1 Tax=Bracon brevicornis TaxID=1563983 RepID=A0A6V7M123_9HYME
MKIQSDSKSEEDSNLYTATARLVSLEDFLSQTQENMNKLDNSEKELEFGREMSPEILKDNQNSSEDKTEYHENELNMGRKILNLNEVISQSEREKLEKVQESLRSSEDTKKLSEGMLWHIRLGHTSLEYLKQLQRTEEKLEKVKFGKEISECEICILSKMENIPFKEKRTRAPRAIHTIHTDTMGPIKPTSFPGESKFIIVFVDDYTRYARAYCVKQKNEAGKCLEKFITHTRNLLGKQEKVCFIRADNGTEFTGGEFSEIMEKEGISRDFAPPYTSELNGTAERFNKTIQKKIRALMLDSGIPSTMWITATEAAVHIYNRTPHKSNEFKTPLSKLCSEKKSHLESLKRFGSVAYVKIPIAENKFSERALKTILVGYTPTGSLLWHPQTNRFINSRHVKCNEKLSYKNLVEQSEKTEIPEIPERIGEEMTEGNNESQKPEATELIKPRENSVEKEQVEPSVKRRKLPSRKAKTDPKRDPDYVYRVLRDKSDEMSSQNEDEIITARLAKMNGDPTSYKGAMESPEKENWKRAIQEELQSMQENEVWEITERPIPNHRKIKPNIIDSKWVFKKKIDEKGQEKFKARLVIRGFKDKNTYELRETYAPVSRMAVIRASLAIINKFDLDAVQLDVKTAFLNGILEDEVFMEIPEGANTSASERTKVCRLKKTLYGLKISPKKWNQRFTEEVSKLGLERDIHDPCLFTWRKGNTMAFLVLYVDDIILASNCPLKKQEITAQLCGVFKMRDLGEPKMFLGMEIFRDRVNKILKIKQTEYTEKILRRFNMYESKPQSTPMITRQAKNRENDRSEETEREHPSNAPYREAIGSLLYLAGATRPDISYAVNYLSRKQRTHTENDWEEVKRLFRYLKGTPDLGLIFRAEGNKLEAFTDASFRDWEDSTSTSGYVIKLYGDTIAWRSHKQSYVTLSTCQAEYLAMSESCQEMISLDKAIRDITGETSYPVDLWCDNMSAGKCTQMDGAHKLKSFDDSVTEIQRKLKDREIKGQNIEPSRDAWQM